MIDKTMYHHCFVELCLYMKLKDNRDEIKKGEEGHDPCAKYHLVWDVKHEFVHGTGWA